MVRVKLQADLMTSHQKAQSRSFSSKRWKKKQNKGKENLPKGKMP